MGNLRFDLDKLLTSPCWTPPPLRISNAATRMLQFVPGPRHFMATGVEHTADHAVPRLLGFAQDSAGAGAKNSLLSAWLLAYRATVNDDYESGAALCCCRASLVALC